MRKLKVPSLQHLARNGQESPEGTAKKLVHLARNSPSFSYAQLDGLVIDLLVLRQPLEMVLSAANRVKRDSVRKHFLEILPLIDEYFQKARPDFVQRVTGRLFPIARGLMVPFSPPLLYGTNGNLCFPWLSYWRSNPLHGANLSLFVTAVDEVLRQDPDLENAAFQILDLSAPAIDQPRTLKVIDSRDVPRLSKSDLDLKLQIFAEGFFIAERVLSSDPSLGQRADKPAPDANDSQCDLFPAE